MENPSCSLNVIGNWVVTPLGVDAKIAYTPLSDKMQEKELMSLSSAVMLGVGR